MANGVAGDTKRGKRRCGRGAAAVAQARSITVLGVDPGLERTGYAVVEMPSGRVIDAGLVRTTVSGTLSERLLEIETGMEEVLGEHAVGLVAVEELFSHYKHPRTAILMGHARGVLLLAAARRGIEMVGLSATEVKKTLTGNGHAGKAQIQRAIMAALHLPQLPEPADVADALAVAVCAGLMRSRARNLRGVRDSSGGADPSPKRQRGVFVGRSS